MSDLVVDYTRTNTTKNVASIIKDELDADVLEVIDKKNRQGPIGYLRGGLDAIRSKKTSIEYEDVNFEKYDNIYIGTPVWASKPTPAIMEFISQNNFTNKNIILFATMMSSGGEETVDIMKKLIEDKDGIVVNSFVIATKTDDITDVTLKAIRN